MNKLLYMALCLITAVLVTLSFAACGADNTQGSSTPTGGSSAQSTEADGTSESTDNNAGADSSTDASDAESDESNDGQQSSDSSVTQESEYDPWLPDNDHVHEYETEYSYDETYHYYAASCEHINEKKDMEKHSYSWETGNCKCGYSIDIVKALIETAISNNSKIKSIETFTVKLREGFRDEISESFANYGSYIFSKSIDSDYTTSKYYTITGGSIFAVLVQDEKVSLIADVLEEDLKGTKYTFTYMYDFDNYVIGAEALLNHFYTMGAENVNGDFTSGVNDGVYSFSYGIFLDYEIAYFNVINVSFTMDKSTSTLKTVSIDVKRYSQDSCTVTDGIYTLNSDAKCADETQIEITQGVTVDKNSENPYSPTKVLPQSIAVKDKWSGKNINGLIMDIESGSQINVYFDEIKPASALIGLCNVSITVIDNADKSIVEVNPFNYGSGYMFSMTKPGEYTLRVDVNGIISEATVNVALKKPSTISAQVYSEHANGYEIVKIINVFAGTPVYLKSYVNDDCNPEYTAKLIGDALLGCTLGKGTFNGEAVTVFRATEAGKYTVQLTSSVNTGTTCTLLINVMEMPSLEELLNGSYIGENEFGDKVSFDFDVINMTVTAALESAYGNELLELVFSTDNGVLTYEYVDGDDFVEELYISEHGNLVTVVYGETYVLTKIEEEKTLVSSGTIEVEDVFGEGKASYTYRYEYYSTGEIVIYKDYSVYGADITLKLTKDGVVFKYSTYETFVLTAIEGVKGELAGVYKAELDSVLYANVTITKDKTPAYVKEPTYGTLELVDKSTGSSGNKLDYVYNYKIENGVFVIYKDGAVTDEIVLELVDGEYMFRFPRVLNSMPLVKYNGQLDILGGDYNVQMKMGDIYYVLAKIYIVPGAGVEIDPVPTEPTYGTLELFDKSSGQTTVYTYEIIDGAFVFYKDNVKTDEIIVIANADGTYTFQTAGNPVPQILIKVEGEGALLAGVYNYSDETQVIYTLTFVPGKLEEEAQTGKVTVTSNLPLASEFGEYTYTCNDGGFTVNKDGQPTGDIVISYDADGTTILFQCIDTPQPQKLVKVEGHSGVLAGTYNVVNGSTGTVIYTVVFLPDVIEA